MAFYVDECWKINDPFFRQIWGANACEYRFFELITPSAVFILNIDYEIEEEGAAYTVKRTFFITDFFDAMQLVRQEHVSGHKLSYVIGCGNEVSTEITQVLRCNRVDRDSGDSFFVITCSNGEEYCLFGSWDEQSKVVQRKLLYDFNRSV